METLVSVVVPIFQVEKYLTQCVDSLLGQDYHEIELILVDDGSPDDCGRICDEYLQKDSRVKVIHQENGGLSAARNAGIAISKGDYLMFVDGDDWVEHNYCSYALEKAQETESDIVVFGYTDRYDSHSVVNTIPRDVERRYSVEEALLELHGGRILSFAWNKIYKASLFQNGIRYPVGKLFEDIGTTYRLFHEANAIYLVSGVTYNYRKRGDSILGRKVRAKDMVDWYEMERERFDFMQKNYPHLTASLWRYYGSRVLNCLKTVSRNAGFEESQQEMSFFLLRHESEIIKSGLNDPDLKLLYFSSYLFNAKGKVLRLVKRFI